MPSTVEIWKLVVDYEDSYEVSSFGRVRSKDRIISRENGIESICKGVLVCFNVL